MFYVSSLWGRKTKHKICPWKQRVVTCVSWYWYHLSLKSVARLGGRVWNKLCMLWTHETTAALIITSCIMDHSVTMPKVYIHVGPMWNWPYRCAVSVQNVQVLAVDLSPSTTVNSPDYSLCGSYLIHGMTIQGWGTNLWIFLLLV